MNKQTMAATASLRDEAKQAAEKAYSPTYRYDGDDWTDHDYGAKVKGFTDGYVAGTESRTLGDAQHEKVAQALSEHEITSDLICMCGHTYDYEDNNYEEHPERWGVNYRAHQIDVMFAALNGENGSEQE